MWGETFNLLNSLWEGRKFMFGAVGWRRWIEFKGCFLHRTITALSPPSQVSVCTDWIYPESGKSLYISWIYSELRVCIDWNYCESGKRLYFYWIYRESGLIFLLNLPWVRSEYVLLDLPWVKWEFIYLLNQPWVKRESFTESTANQVRVYIYWIYRESNESYIDLTYRESGESMYLLNLPWVK